MAHSADKNLVKLRPEVHCANVGPRGGDMCSKLLPFLILRDRLDIFLTEQRDYIDIVNDFPFTSTLIAPEASYSPSDVTGLSSPSIEQLLETSMQIVVSTTVAFVRV